MSEPRVVFSQAVEALYRYTVGPRMTPALKEALRKEGIEAKDRYDPAYEQAKWIRTVQLSASALFPDLPKHEAERRLGHAFMDGYGRTMVGAAIFGLLRVLGPRRTMDRMTKNFRSGSNYIETRLKPLGDTSVELWMNESRGLQSFAQGVLEAALRVAGAQAVVTIRESEAESCTYLAKW